MWAGLDGIRNNRTLPPRPERDFWEMSEIDREVAGVRPLPRSLDLALETQSATTRAVVLGCEAILVLDAFWALVLL